MKGRLYIDGKDAYTEYGIYVVDGGWNELIAYPPLKPVETNDWQEIDGIEADLSNPVLDSREVAVKIAVSGLFSSFNALLSVLSDGAYHNFECAYIHRRYKLRLVALPNLSVTQSLGVAILKFADDFPMQGYKYHPPKSNIDANYEYAFDGTPFSDYGVHILKGTHDEVIRKPDVKLNLLRNIETKAGAIYDGKGVTYKGKDVKIFCLLRAETLDELWRNYDALLYNLIRPNERTLDIDEYKYPFYYKSCQVSDFYPDGKIWLQFTITVAFTKNYEISEIEAVLASEDGEIVITEDEELAIDLSQF